MVMNLLVVTLARFIHMTVYTRLSSTGPRKVFLGLLFLSSAYGVLKDNQY